ncbi:MAG: response regulator [Candidatus Rokuibacteriota bacterium]
MDRTEAQRIIVVDDDDCVREAMEMILDGAGHSVRATASGAEALRWLDEQPCDLLILDFKIPEMDGPTIYRRMLTRWPVGGPRVLFVSGHAGVAGYENDPDILAVPLLYKPFNLGDFFAAVARALATV